MMRHNKGFSLVELVIVIAIMAILVGVAVPVFSAYVEKSQKAVDKDLVAGIMHAIKVGTYSDAFVNNDSFKMGSLSFPVGFVVLTTDGIQVITSATEVYPATTGKCEFVTEENVTILSSATETARCGLLGTHNYTKYTITTGNVTYCKSHTATADVAQAIEKLSGGTTREFTTGCSCTASGIVHSHKWEDSKQTVSNTTIVDTKYLYLPSQADATLCEAAYANQYGTFGTPEVTIAGPGNALYDAIVATYGEDLSELKLTYDEWTSDEGIDFATFYTSAPQLMGDLESISGLLAIASQQSLIDLGISTRYENGEAVFLGVSGNIAATFADVDAWMQVWNNDAGMTWDSYGFNLQGRENYSAARMAYNNAFASYLEAKGETKYLDTIRKFYSQELVGVGLPGLICSDAFTDPDSKLRTKITNTEDLQHLADLYDEYLESDAFVENGRLVYNTLKTISDTADTAQAYAKQNGISIFDYYNSYVDEMAGLYTKAREAAGNGIVIIVVVENGVLSFQTTPAEANPDAD